MKVQVYGLGSRYGSGLRFRFTTLAEPIVIITIGCVYIYISYNIINPYLLFMGLRFRFKPIVIVTIGFGLRFRFTVQVYAG